MLCTIVPNPNGLAAEVCCAYESGELVHESVPNIDTYLSEHNRRSDVIEILLGAPNAHIQALARDLSVPVTVRTPTAAELTRSYLTALKLEPHRTLGDRRVRVGFGMSAK